MIHPLAEVGDCLYLCLYDINQTLITRMKSTIYKVYTPPQCEIIEVELENAVLSGSERPADIDPLYENTFSW